MQTQRAPAAESQPTRSESARTPPSEYVPRTSAHARPAAHRKRADLPLIGMAAHRSHDHARSECSARNRPLAGSAITRGRRSCSLDWRVPRAAGAPANFQLFKDPRIARVVVLVGRRRPSCHSLSMTDRCWPSRSADRRTGGRRGYRGGGVRRSAIVISRSATPTGSTIWWRCWPGIRSTSHPRSLASAAISWYGGPNSR